MTQLGPLSRIKSKFLRDTATLQVSAGLNQVSQFFTTILIAYLLGAEGQGKFVSAIALQALIYFLVNVGVAQATVSQIAQNAARGNDEKVAEWLAFLVKAILVIGLGIMLAGYFILPWVGEVMYGTTQGAEYGREIGFWAWILCLQPLLELPRVAAGAAFQGTRRMLHLGQSENGQEIVRMFLVVLGATISGSPWGALVGQLAAAGVGSIIAIDLYRRATLEAERPLPGLRAVLSRVRAISLLRGLRLGLRVGILKNSNTLFINVFPRLIVGGVVGVKWVSYFHIAQRLLAVPLMFTLGVTRTMLPALGELAGLKDMRRFRQLFVKVSVLGGLMVSAAILIGLPLVQPLVGMFFPDDYKEPVWTFYWILALGYIFVSFANGLDAFYIVTNQLRVWFIFSVLGAVTLIPVNVWLILNVPYTGTAWGLTVYHGWLFVHYGYFFVFFATGRHRRVWADVEPSAAVESSAAAEG